MSRPRAAGRLLALGLALAICLPPHFVTLALRRPSPWPRRFFGLAARSIAVDMQVRGVPLTRAVLIVANHRSWLDVLVIAAASGCAFVSKAEVRRWPVVGWLATLHRTVFVERSRRGDARDQADALHDALAAGQAVALFPEGLTHSGEGILPFKPSLFAAVCPAPPGVRVQPALIDYGPHKTNVNWPDAESAARNILRILGRRGRLAVSIAFLAPLDPAAYPDRKALAAAARLALEDEAVSR